VATGAAAFCGGVLAILRTKPSLEVIAGLVGLAVLFVLGVATDVISMPSRSPVFWGLSTCYTATIGFLVFSVATSSWSLGNLGIALVVSAATLGLAIIAA